MSLLIGETAHVFTTKDAFGQPIALTDFQGKPILLAFFRYTGCPLCNIRFWLLTERYAQLHSRGLQIIAVFASSPADVQQFAQARQSPFPVIADPNHELFRRYGIGTSWFGFFKGFLVRGKDYREARERGLASWTINGKMNQLPAEFLIAPDLTIATAHYGKDMGDFLPLATIETFIAQFQPTSVSASTVG